METLELKLEGNIYRLKRLNSSISVEDITDAGKRGKTCTKYSFYTLCDDQRGLNGIWGQLPKFSVLNSLDQVSALLTAGTYVLLEKTEYKAVDVKPYGFRKVLKEDDNVEVIADFDHFRVSNKRDTMNEPRIISRGKKTSIKKFYKLAESGELDGLDFSEIARKLQQSGIDYHRYCAMD